MDKTDFWIDEQELITVQFSSNVTTSKQPWEVAQIVL